MFFFTYVGMQQLNEKNEKLESLEKTNENLSKESINYSICAALFTIFFPANLCLTLPDTDLREQLGHAIAMPTSQPLSSEERDQFLHQLSKCLHDMDISPLDIPTFTVLFFLPFPYLFLFLMCFPGALADRAHCL